MFHDSRNATKAACKGYNGGIIWRHIVRFAAVANLGFGPYRSGAWGLEKQETLAHLASVKSPRDIEFMAAVDAQAELMGDGRSQGEGAPDYEAWFGFFSGLQSCVSADPVVKFARWGSLQDAWEY